MGHNLEIIFPKGYWICANNGHPAVGIERGKACSICKKAPPPQLRQRVLKLAENVANIAVDTIIAIHQKINT